MRFKFALPMALKTWLTVAEKHQSNPAFVCFFSSTNQTFYFLCTWNEHVITRLSIEFVFHIWLNLPFDQSHKLLTTHFHPLTNKTKTWRKKEWEVIIKCQQFRLRSYLFVISRTKCLFCFYFLFLFSIHFLSLQQMSHISFVYFISTDTYTRARCARIGV